MKFTAKQWISSSILSAILITQLLSVAILFTPDQVALAQTLPSRNLSSIVKLPVGAAVSKVTSVPEWNWYEFWKDLGLGIARGAAHAVSTKFLNDFVDKMVAKYKIRNYLYYDKVLTDYYLNRFIADNVTDPDLRAIYSLLDKAYITGQATGTTGAPDPSKALIPRLNLAINKAYRNRGGIDPARIYNPKSYKNDGEYFAAAQTYFKNPPIYLESDVQAQFAGLQSSATTASQLEILVGSGLKNGRIIGGQCVISNGDGPTVVDPNSDPETCKKAGGVWNPAALDQARSFIDNPTIFIDRTLDAAIKRHIDNDFDPNNFWAVIGSLLGNFLVKQFVLKKGGGTLPDSPDAFVPLPGDSNYGNEDPSTGIDIDGDGIPDGFDYDGDGIIDQCSFGGTAPNCDGSKGLIDDGGGACQITSMQLPELPNARADGDAAMRQAFTNLPDDANFTGPTAEDDPALIAAATAIIKEAGNILKAQGYDVAGASLNCNGNVSKDLLMIGKSENPFAAVYDVFRGIEGAGTLASKFSGLAYVHHTDIKNVR